MTLSDELRKCPKCYSTGIERGPAQTVYECKYCPLRRQAADELDRLEAKVAELEDRDEANAWVDGFEDGWNAARLGKDPDIYENPYTQDGDD